MKFPGMSRLSPSFLWEAPVFILLAYLLLHPPMVYPQAMAVALGGVLFLVLFQRVKFLENLGGAWWLFLAYALVASFSAYVPGLALQGSGLLFGGTLLYLLAAQRPEGSKKHLETWLLILGALASLWALAQWAWGFDQLKFQLAGLSKADFLAVEKAIYYRRPSGPFATVGSLAAFLLLLVPLAVSRVRAGSKARLHAGLTLLFLVTLALTQSVGAWVSLGAALLTLLVLRREAKWTGMILAVLALALGVILFTRGWHQWAVGALGMRALLWDSAWKLFLAHPLLGTGLGSFDEAYQRAGFSLSRGGARYPHNILLQLLCETGLVGTGLVLASLVGWLRRLKVPSRWEGWGVGAGALAFLYFSLFDLPFQMPELAWVFALMLGRLEFRTPKTVKLPKISASCVKIALLVVLGVTGFWPPFRPLNFAILATVLWMTAAFFQEKIEKVPGLFFLGGAFLLVRAFDSPSALGTVRCLEMVGLALAFVLFLRGIADPGRFLKWFMGLGLFFGAAVWAYSFRFSDIRDWTIFPNPKQVGTFLVVGALYWMGGAPGLRVGRWSKGVATLFTAATLVCLKAFGAMAAAVAGAFSLLSTRAKWVGVAVGVLFLGIILYFRTWVFRGLDTSPTQWDRFGIWASAWRVFARVPWFGAGPGAFAGLYHQVKAPRTNGVSRFLMDAQFAHNEFLEFLVAFGAVGVLFLLLFLVFLWDRKAKGTSPSLWALGAAAFVDFCLHTPLILLQGAGLLAGDREKKKEEGSWGSALLVGGLALGLFGSAAWAPRAMEQAKVLEAQGQLPQALRSLQYAEKVNAWDNRYTAAKAEFLESLFRATQDPAWASAADEAFQRSLSLEKTDGQGFLRDAERLTARLDQKATLEAVQSAEVAWAKTHRVLPFNAFARFEEGLFQLKKGDREKALLSFETAAQLEPNFAAAWMRSGWILKAKGERANARYCFRMALQAHERWKDAERIDPLEKELIALPPEALEGLARETRP